MGNTIGRTNGQTDLEVEIVIKISEYENMHQIENKSWEISFRKLKYLNMPVFGDQDVHCYNVIPMEITQQICEAITEGRR